MDAARSLSDEDLIALESDLELFEETGLIGVQMSGLLKLILQAPLAA